MSIIDHMNELRAELKECLFTKAERTTLETKLAAFIAERDAAGKADAETSHEIIHAFETHR